MTLEQFAVWYLVCFPWLWRLAYLALDPFYVTSVRKIGGLWFIRYRRFVLSFCVSNRCNTTQGVSNER